MRRGNLPILIAVLLVPIVGMLALSVDVSYSMRKHDELQRAADFAALAGARELVPDANGQQSIENVNERIRDVAQSRLSSLSNFSQRPVLGTSLLKAKPDMTVPEP